jgi:hypothetical protein
VIRRALGLLVALAACGPAAAPELVPVVEAPASGSDGYPWDGVDELVLSIARAGDTDLQAASAGPGEALALTDLDFGSDLVLHLSGSEGGLEVAYGRSCAFDLLADQAPPEVRIYFARIVKWAATAPGATSRRGALGFTTLDGAAVFVGGEVGAGAGTAEAFEPRAGAFAALDLDPPLFERTGGALAVLPDGRALLVGGQGGDGEPLPLAELLDARTPRFAELEAFDGPAVIDHAAVGLVDGDVLVVGGRARPAAAAPLEVSAAAYLLHFGDGGAPEPFRLLEAGPAIARADHTATRLGDEVGADVLLVGGQGADGLAIAQAELYRPLRGRFELVDGALLGVPRWDHVALRLPGGFVLIAGGRAPDPDGGPPLPVDVVELYDPVLGQFTIAGELPARAGRTDLAASPLGDGRVLLSGGIGADGLAVDTVVIAALDPVSGQVTLSPTDRLDAPRAGLATAALCDGTVLVVGGADEPGAPEAERYDPPAAGRR